MKTKPNVVSFTMALAFCIAGQAGAATFHSRPVSVFGGSNVLVTGINDSGEMVLNWTDSNGMAHCEWMSGTNTLEIIDPHEIGTGSGAGTSCWGINNAGQIVGSYSLPPWGNGFLYSSGIYTDVIVPGATAGTTAYGLNNTGSIVGAFADNVGQHGFLFNINANSFTTLDVPGAAYTLAVAVNDSGEITFEWLTASFVYNGATLKNGHYRTLNVPGMVQSKARGINVHGWINFDAQDGLGQWHGFLYKGGVFTQYDVASSANTYGFGINSSGKLVGGFNPASSPTKQVGFQGSIH